MIGEKFWTSDGYEFHAIAAFCINLVLSFVLALCLQMQLLSGLDNYVEWMDDVSSLLDPIFSKERGLPYLSMIRQSNALSWIEMRTYLYTKGLIIFSRQEIFVLALVLINVFTVIYLLYRLLTDNSPLYESETYNAIFFWFIVVCYSLGSLLRTVRSVETLQLKQEALLRNQKLKIYHKRITYHPQNQSNSSNNNNSSEGNGNEGFELTVPSKIDKIKIEEQDNNDINDNNGIFDDEQKPQGLVLTAGTKTKIKTNRNRDRNRDRNRQNSENEYEYENEDEKDMKQDILDTSCISGNIKDIENRNTSTTSQKSNKSRNENNISKNANQNVVAGGFALLSVQNEDYLRNSETFLQDIESIVKAQDIIPRICGIQLHKVVGLAILAALFAVIPTALKAAADHDNTGGG